MIKNLYCSIVILLIFIPIIFLGCNNDQKTAKNQADSTRKSDSTRVADSTAKVMEERARVFNIKDSANTVAVMGIDLTDASCAEITRIIGKNSIQDPLIYSLYLLKAIECKNRVFNEAHPEAATVTVVHEENGKILFNTLRVNTAEKLAEAAKKIVTVGAFIKSGGDVPITTVATIAGNYTVDAFLKESKKNNPLIIIMPTAIPNIQMAKDALTLDPSNIVKAIPIDPSKPLKIIANGAEFSFVGAKAAAEFVKSTPGYVIDASGKVIKVVGQGAGAVAGVATDVAEKAAKAAAAPLVAIGKVLGF